MAQAGGQAGVGDPNVTKAGNNPNDTAYGNHDITVDFSRRLYAHADATATT